MVPPKNNLLCDPALKKRRIKARQRHFGRSLFEAEVWRSSVCLEEGRPAAGFVWVGYDPPLQPAAALFCSDFSRSYECGGGNVRGGGARRRKGGEGERKGQGGGLLAGIPTRLAHLAFASEKGTFCL